MKKPGRALLGVAIACVTVFLLALGLRRKGSGGAQEADQKRPTDPSEVHEVTPRTLDGSGQGTVSQEGPRADQPSGSTEDAIGKARRLLSDLRAAVRQEDGSSRRIDNELSGMGPVIVPEIRSALRDWTPDESYYLLRVLLSTPGDESTGLLFELATDGSRSKCARWAFAMLENRPIRTPISEPQLQVLTGIVQESSVLRAGHGARVLGKCEAVPGEKRAEVILAGYVKELQRPSDLGEELPGVYLSPQVYALNQFLLGFSYVGKDAIPVIREALNHAKTESEKKWLHMALGRAGDPDMMEKMRGIVLHDPDTSVRTVAVWAYARAAGQQAVPFLTSLLDDDTPGEYRGGCFGQQSFPIRSAAQGELSTLRRAADATPSEGIDSGER